MSKRIKIAKRVGQLPRAEGIDIAARVKEMKAAGEYVINFGVGEPDFNTPENIKQAGVAAIHAGFTRYPPTAGFSDLKAAICRKLKEDNELDYEQSQVVVSCGAKHCLYNIFQVLCEAGDEVIIPAPYWNSYYDMVRLAEANPVIVNTTINSGFKITREQLEKAITAKTAALIINSPANPTGTVYTEDELRKLADIAVSRGITVISDEIYEKFIYDGLKHCSIAALSNDIYNRTITVNGLSKSHSMTGWRIGYLAGPKEIAGAITYLQGNSTSGACSISQKAAVTALIKDNPGLSNMADEFRSRRDYMLAELGKIKGLACFKPSGAFYIFCDISKTGLGSTDFARRLFDSSKVAVLPGKVFGWDTHVRISFAAGMEDIKKGLADISNFMRTL